MSLGLNELKIKAKKMHKALRQGQHVSWLGKASSLADNWSLTDCQNWYARQLGLPHWQAVNALFTGKASEQGTLWHHPGCNALLNQWFSDYAEAKAVCQNDPSLFLFPYKNQFVVSTSDYCRALGLQDHLSQLASANNDLVSSIHSSTWDLLAHACLNHQFRHHRYQSASTAIDEKD